MKRKCALVTGSAIRLGKSIALFLAKMGYDIALHYNSSMKKALESAEEIKELKVDCEIFQSTFNKIENIETLIKKVKNRFNSLSILVNSASLYIKGNILESNSKMFDEQFNINLKAPFFLIKHFATNCKKGNIINIIDNKIAFQQFHYSIYLLSKKSLAELTYLSSIELAPKIRVNGISPGIILPIDSRSKKYLKWRIEGIPLKKQGQLINVNKAVEYILKNDFISGQILTVDGAENINNVGQNFENYLSHQKKEINT